MRQTVSRSELMPDGTDAVFRGFIHDFLAFSARVNEVRAGFGNLIGLSGVAYSTLVSIAFLQEDEGVGLSRVAEQLHLSGAFVTIEVAKLVKAGFVRKRVNVRDRRRVLLTTTAKGRKLLTDLEPIQAQVNDALFECLSADDFLRLRATMADLIGCGDRALLLLGFLSQSSSLGQPLAPEPFVEDVPQKRAPRGARAKARAV